MKERLAIQRCDEQKALQSGRRTRRGFSLVELMVVVGIIALLLAILLPAMNSIRKNAKATKTAALLAAIEKGLNSFHTDFGEYPDSTCPNGSTRRPDPVVSWPAVGSLPTPPDLIDDNSSNNSPLTGAHWLARAMAGHDQQGVDVQGKTLGRLMSSTDVGKSTVNIPIDYYKYYDPPNKNGRAVDRRSAYLEGEMFARDDDPTKFNTQKTATSDFDPRRRLVIYDESFGSPVLYYRANPRAQTPFCRSGFGDDRMGSQAGDMAGVYCHQDNSYITGDDQASQTQHSQGWDFAGLGQTHSTDPAGKKHTHNIATFGIAVGNVAAIQTKDSFVEFARNPAAAGQAKDAAGNSISITPHNPDTFILLTAGPDGVFGTGDDIGNFPIKK